MNSHKTLLDFVIIGAQKAGTTTLFKHLAEHPAIYMPPEKEAPFFSDDERYEKGLDWFIQEFFADAPQTKLWGKASPQYMTDRRVPERLASQLPEAKLVAILRDPVSRAYSHYKMNVRRKIETRSFEEVIQTQLRADALKDARLNPMEESGCIVWGEYGRILSNYLQHFPREQLLVLFTDDLDRNPGAVMREIYDFLALPVVFPKHLGKKFHRGGMRERFPWMRGLIRISPMIIVWRLLSAKTKRRIRYWFNQWNTLPEDTVEAPLTSETLKDLSEHYQTDLAALREIVQKPFCFSMDFS